MQELCFLLALEHTSNKEMAPSAPAFVLVVPSPQTTPYPLVFQPAQRLISRKELIQIKRDSGRLSLQAGFHAASKATNSEVQKHTSWSKCHSILTFFKHPT